MTPTISRAKLKDLNQIYELGNKTPELNFSKDWHFHEFEELQEFTKDKNSIFLVSKENNEICGFIIGKIIDHASGGWFMLDVLVIDKKYRNKGMAKDLLQETYKILKSKKINYVQILEANNKKTRTFWKEMGFKETKKFIWAEKNLN